jgi:DNA-directed DNA polymerase III alpha subunit
MSKVTKRVVGMEIISPGSPPDIDSDFSTVSKDRAYDYVSDLYGHDNVSHIVTFNTLGAKSAFKRMCTIYSVSFSQANRIAGMMPEGVEGHKITFDDIYDEKSDYYEDAADFRAATSGSEWLPIITGARSIANKVQGTGVHACGVIISNKPLTDTIPLMVDSKDGKVTTQWSYQECEALGLIKMDFLGLDTVDLIQHTVEFIQRSGKEPPNMTEIIHGKMDDEGTYRLFQRGETIGVFQFGSEMVRGLLKHMKPTEFNDLAACTAVARPGPMGMNSHTMYADRKNNLAPVEPIHPDFVGSPLEEILGGTYGLCVPAGTLIEDSTTGRRVPIESFTEGHRTPSWDPDTGSVVHSPVFKVIHTGMQDVVKVCTWDGWETTVGVDHEMLTPSGFVKAGELTTHDSVGVISQGRLRWDRVTTLEAAGVVNCYDLDVDNTHTYLVDGFVTHNCVYQEQIMQLAQRIAGMSLQEGDKLRKAMGKKKADVMAKMKPRFIQGGVGNGYSEEAMNKLWDILEPFAKYAFNKCLHGDTEVLTSQNTKTTVKDLYHRFKNGEKNIKILSMFEGGGLHFHNISEIVQTGRKPLWTVETESGKTIKITENHRMLTTNGYRTIKSGGIQVGSELIDDKYWNNRFRTVQRRPTPRRGWSHKSISYHEVKNISFSSDVDKTLAENYLIARGAIFETNKIISSPKEEILGTADFFVNGTYFEMDSKGLGRQHLIDSKYGTVPFVYLTPENYRDEIDAALMTHHIENGDPIVSIRPPKVLESGSLLREMTYDITMSDDGPANFIANGLVSHNSHSVAYAMNAYQAAYLKTHYPVEFMSALVAQTISDRDKTLNNLREARRMGLTMGTVDINLSEVRMAPDYSGESPFEILYGISGVKSVSEDSARLIVAERERGGRFTSVYDAVTRCVAAGVNNKTVLVNLALAGAFDGLEPNRRRVVEAIPALLSVGRDESSKGMSLLAALDVPGEDIFMMPDVEDYSYTDRLGMEADMVGLYLSSHPMDHADLSPFGATPLKAVASAASGFGSGTARVVAAVSGIEMRTTGRGKMCTLHLDDGDGFLSVRLSPKVISGVEKFEAMEDIKTRFRKGEMEVPKSTVAKALKDVPVVETIRQNMVYVMDVTYRRMFGGGQGSVRVDSIRPVTFTHDGGLPVRVRINVDRLGVDRARKAYVAIPRMLAEKTPGSTPIMIAHYRLGDGTVTSDEDRCRYALEVMRREKATAGSSDDTRKGKKKNSRHDTGGSGGKTPSLLGDDNGHDESETEPRVKDTVGRQWPTEVPAEFIKNSEAGVDDMRSFADALEYRDTGLTAAPSTDTSRILEKYLGHENYDFGMYVPVVAYS